MRFRSSGTTIAFARLRQIVIGLYLFLELRAGRFELRFGGARKDDAREAERLFRRVARTKNFDAVAHLADEAGRLQCIRRHDDGRIPRLEIDEVDHRVLGAEDLRRARLLRHAATLRQTAIPRCLSAFEVGALAAARARGLTFAAFAAGLDHAAAVAA